jgi:hypothetical protein
MNPPKGRIKSTIFLTKENREIVKASGKTVQGFFEDLFDLYVAHDMGSWRRGHLFHRQTRILVVRGDFLDRILNDVSDPYDMGKKIGESAWTTVKVMWGFDAKGPGNRKRYFELRNKISGWGIFSEPSEGTIIVESPAMSSSEFLRGYLEGVFSIRLRTVEATADRIVFQVEQEPPS